MEDLPPPDGPTSASVSPARTVREKSCGEFVGAIVERSEKLEKPHGADEVFRQEPSLCFSRLHKSSFSEFFELSRSTNVPEGSGMSSPSGRDCSADSGM